jgi:hypothetical protein
LSLPYRTAGGASRLQLKNLFHGRALTKPMAAGGERREFKKDTSKPANEYSICVKMKTMHFPFHGRRSILNSSCFYSS